MGNGWPQKRSVKNKRMQQTAITKAIIKIKEHKGNRYVLHKKDVIQILGTLLKDEQEQIMEAYEDGQSVNVTKSKKYFNDNFMQIDVNIYDKDNQNK